MVTIAELLSQAHQLDSDSAKLDTELLLAYVLGKSRTFLFTWPEKTLNEQEVDVFQTLFARRKTGEPVAHLIGSKDFWSLDLKVTADTLIPRPETELLVELCLEKCAQYTMLNVLDLGTGTGAIALAIAKEKPRWHVTAVDRIDNAVALAKANKAANGITNVEIFQSNWFENISAALFDVIISNPPYIDASDPHLQQGDVRFEPHSALIAEDNGLRDIKNIIAAAPSYLNDHGMLMIEHGFQQKASVQHLFEQYGFHLIETHKDLAGLDRVTLGVLS